MLTVGLQIKKGRPFYHAIIRFKDETGKIRQKWETSNIPIKGNNKRKADEWRDEVYAKYKQQNVDLGKDAYFTDFITAWLETRRITNKIQLTTHDSYLLTLNTHILPYFEPLRLKVQQIEPRHIQEYVTHKMEKQGLSVNTVKKHLANIICCLDSAVKQNIIPFNPATRIEEMKKVKFEGAKPLNETEIEQLLDCFGNDPLETIVCVSLFYGLRRSEILGLRYSAIDFENNTLSIEHTVVKVTATHRKDQTKSASSKAILPLPSIIKARLLEWQKEQARHKALQPNDYIESDYVCTMFNGRLMHPDFITKHFQRVLARNNFPAMRFHDLRHSSATYLKYLGFDPKDIQTWLRHADIQTTMNLYTHMDMAAKWEIAERLEAKMGKMGL